VWAWARDVVSEPDVGLQSGAVSLLVAALQWAQAPGWTSASVRVLASV
jgi:hypothetical protein